MKIKHVLATLTFSLAAGFAAFGLANHQGKVAEETRAFVEKDGNYTLYFNFTWAASDFKTGRYALYWFNATTNGWVDINSTATDYFKAVVPGTAATVIPCGMKAQTEGNNWDNVNKQTHDITLADKIGEADNTIGVNSTYSYDKYGYWWEVREPEHSIGTMFLRGTWAGGWCDTDKVMTVSAEDSNVYEISDVTLTSGNQIKALQVVSDYALDWYDGVDVEGNSTATIEEDGGVKNVTINENGIYDISYNVSTEIYTINVAEDEDLTAAVEFVNDFNTSMGKYCPLTGTDTDHRGAEQLVSEWSTFKSRFNNDSLTSEKARDYLKTLDDATLNDFRERYDSIYGDYANLLEDYDFLGRHANQTNKVMPVSSDNTVLMVTVMSSISLIAVASFFMLKKKKESK